MNSLFAGSVTRRHYIAVVALLVGTGVIVRGLWLAWPGPTPTPISPAAGQVSVGAAAQSRSSLFELRLETEVSPDVLPDLMAEVERRIHHMFVAQSADGPSGRKAALLGQGTADYLRGVLSGSPDEYLAFIEKYEGAHSIDLTDDQTAAGFRTFFQSANGSYANGRVSLEHLVVRPRVLNGANVYQDDFGAHTSMTHADSRFPALEKLAYTTPYGQVIVGDTYEVLMPVEYRRQPDTTTILLGVWMTWSPAAGRWLPSRVVTYTSPDARVKVVHPVF